VKSLAHKLGKESACCEGKYADLLGASSTPGIRYSGRIHSERRILHCIAQDRMADIGLELVQVSGVAS
jgi:hypothetical protein